MLWKVSIVLPFLLLATSSVSSLKLEKDVEDLNSIKNARQQKLFSLFSIVTFKNDPCQTNSGTTGTTGRNRNGTCYTAQECSDRGGLSSGNCAAGFGVCCLFVITDGSSTITQNCTYIQNPGFPSVYSSTTGLTYTVSKCTPDVCSLRLDFETFTILGPGSTLEDASHTCQDSFTVTGTSGQSTPVICGMNSGQHVYVDIGPATGATGTISFNFATTSSTTRQWEVKVTQVPCYQSRGRDSGCLQYHTGITGRFESFNFQETTSTSQQHLADQDYDICIRQEDGFCCIRYSLCEDSQSFSINNLAADMQAVDSLCTNDYIEIEGVSATCSTANNLPQVNRICGSALGVWDGALQNLESAAYVCDCSAPFRVHIRTNEATAIQPNDNVAPTATTQARGVCLQYQQLAC